MLTEEDAMPIADTDNPTALRRRLFMLSIGAKAAVLREGAGLHPVRASLVLNGHERLTPAEAKRFSQAVATHVVKLFA